jgi:hypothetical protein
MFGISFSMVTFSAYESLNYNYTLLKDATDNRTREMVNSIVPFLENRELIIERDSINRYFNRIIAQRELNSDLFQIDSIFIVSKDGSLIAHNNLIELNSAEPMKFNKPIYMRSLRMRKGQNPLTQVIEYETNRDGTFLGETLYKMFPDLNEKVILVSSALFWDDKLEASASFHIQYSRKNVQALVEYNKEIYKWILLNSSIVIFAVVFLLWLIFVYFQFSTYKQGHREAIDQKISDTKKTNSRIQTIIEKKETTLKNYLTGSRKALVSNPQISIRKTNYHTKDKKNSDIPNDKKYESGLL